MTEAGGDPLEERLAVRPTSETMFGHMYAQWIQSYRDLPVLLNQWANVVRWEKRTLPFLRTSEFLWQEGHTAHATEEEARAETMQMLDIYATFVEDFLSIPVIRGQKTPSEKFAGAVDTYSLESLMKDGKVLQTATSHYLGQNFAKGFDIQYLDKDNQLKYVYTTSWGISTRLLGAIIMVHGDDRGLVVPPKVAPTQVVVIPIGPPKSREPVVAAAQTILDELQARDIRVKMDARDDVSPGWKFNEYEMRGIPIRIEIGPRDLEHGQAILARRDTGDKIPVALTGLVSAVQALLTTIQSDMYAAAARRLQEGSHVADNMEQLVGYINGDRGLVLAGWCGNEACERAVKDACSATSRNIPFDPPAHPESCVACGQKSVHAVWFAKAY